jgi:GntR family transcriptional regulator
MAFIVRSTGCASPWTGRCRRPALNLCSRPIAHEGAGTPLYRVVVRRLMARSSRARCRPAPRCPARRCWPAAFGVSVGTLRQAVGEMVAEPPADPAPGSRHLRRHAQRERFLFQFFHVERADGLREAPVVETLVVERGRLDDDAAEALGGRAGDPAWSIENRLLLQGKAVVHDHLQLPLAALYRGLTEKRFRDRPGTIYRFYQDAFGITVLRARERVRAVAAGPEVARALGVARGAPVLAVRRTALSFGDRPVEYRVSTIVTGTHEYVQTVNGPA